MKKLYLYIISFVFLWSSYGCSDYLNIVPEGVASMDNAFSNRVNAEKFLATCYSYLPSFDDPNKSVGFLGGDEFWLFPKGSSIQDRISGICWEIGRGSQNSNNPYMNYWDGINNGTNLWIGIRDCNIFLENIHKPRDLNDYERDRWIAEVTFLKAYYHFYLMQLYGPIPIMDENMPVNATQDEVRRFRDPFDDCVDYVVKTLDSESCMENLPLKVINPALDMGRITRPIAAAVKAQVLLFAASPLMNGNSDFSNVKDKRGINPFPQTYDASKWEKAAAAALEAIQIAEEAEHELYEFRDPISLSETTRQLLKISEAVTDRWNSEIIWGSTRPTSIIQSVSMPKLSPKNNNWQAFSVLGPTMTVIENFYSSNGVPISEDNSPYWRDNYTDRFKTTTIPNEGINKHILEIGGTTAKMHLNREYRFYSNVYFDRGTAYMAGLPNDVESLYKLHFLSTEYSGKLGSENYSGTGYLPKKLIGYRSSLTEHAWAPYRYTFPIIRLADVYLMYAEALNESLSAPNEEVYKYVDIVRERAGLKGVVDSWGLHSNVPNKPKTKEGMRDIIHKERLNELSLEGKRFWDLRRWKTPLSKTIKSWNVKGETVDDFYRETVLFERPSYYYRDYLWPLKISTVLQNSNLVQNPGW